MNFVLGTTATKLRFNRTKAGTATRETATKMAGLRRGGKFEVSSPSQASIALKVGYGIEAVRGWQFATFTSKGKWFVIRVK